jgi:hypothetical protein
MEERKSDEESKNRERYEENIEIEEYAPSPNFGYQPSQNHHSNSQNVLSNL